MMALSKCLKQRNNMYIGDIIMIIEEKEYKGIFYNIYNGGGNRCDEIAKFIRRKEYSFAAFSETN